VSDNLPDLYTGPVNAPETVALLPRPDTEPPTDEPITVLVAARTVGGTYNIPLPPLAEDRTPQPEPDAHQPHRDTPRRIRRPVMWGEDGPQPRDGQQTPSSPEPPQPEAANDAPPQDEPQQDDDAPADDPSEPPQHTPASPRISIDYAQAWANARHYYDLHINEDTGWNWPRIRWAWRWIAPAGLGWGINLIHDETALLAWFHDPAAGFWTGALLVGAGSWLVIKTRKQRPAVAWLTRVPLATVTAAWLALPATAPALTTLAAATIHTIAGVINTLTHR
jgi:hypothetical protein